MRRWGRHAFAKYAGNYASLHLSAARSPMSGEFFSRILFLSKVQTMYFQKSIGFRMFPARIRGDKKKHFFCELNPMKLTPNQLFLTEFREITLYH